MERLDSLLVKLNYATGRERAKELIANGQITVNGKLAQKPSMQVEETDDIVLTGETLKYVSRGGLKLEGAIRAFGLDFSGKICVDVGASTGGFTDCMLQNGAIKVYAIDVGTGQLAEKLRADERVISMEQTNIRSVAVSDIGEPADFVSCDVSFISLDKVLPVIYGLLKEEGTAVCLVKPQFEAGKANLNKKGVVTDERVRAKVVKDIRAYAEDLGFIIKGIADSPIKGPEGNIEYLMYLGK